MRARPHWPKQSNWLCTLLFFTHVAVGGEIEGIIKDPQGEPISGAVVEVAGTHQRARTDAEGVFVLRDLSPAEVELHIKAPYHNHANHRVQVGRDTRLEFTLARSPLEIIDITALPWHASDLESATPVDVVTSDALRDRPSATLGDVLRNQLGVHSTSYGPVASSPVIRGLEGPRVLVTQNGLDAGDASRIGPDHAVATETSTAEQIEILRGPATLLYGSGAIGGVVNVVDGRIPQDNATLGRWQMQHDTVADENLIAGSLTTGTGDIAVHLDGFWRESNDYRIPAPARFDTPDYGGTHRLDDSAYESSGFNLGGSYLLNNGFVGLSYGKIDRTYGIPGHEHHHDHDHEHHHNDEGVYADLQQERVQLHSELTLNHRLFNSLNTRLGYTEYRHHEVEHDQIMTTFDSTLSEARVELQHHPLGDWHGALSLHYKHDDLVAEGAEAFTPPSVTESMAVALVEERHFGPVQVQLGGRLEHVTVRSGDVILDSHQADPLSVKREFNPVSLSAGAIWHFTPGYTVSASIARAQRAPSAGELLSYGPHLGTGLFEVGALFEIVGENDSHAPAHPTLRRTPLETSNNIDVSLKKYSGDFGFTLNAFFNQVDNYYSLRATEPHAEDHQHHDDQDDHADEHNHDGLPVYTYRAQDARLYGFEAQAVWQINDRFQLKSFSDYTRATLHGGTSLPRIPPLRVGAQLNFSAGPYSAELGASHYFDQNKTGPLESRSDGYTLWDAQVGYDLNVGLQSITLYLRGHNLTDEEARPHTSFLKHLAPLPGRSFALGIRSAF